MPHGRPRTRLTTRLQKRDRIQYRRAPHGYTTWLRFATEWFKSEPSYLVETSRGRFEIQNADVFEIRTVLTREFCELVSLAQEGVEADIRTFCEEHLPHRPFYLWLAVVRREFLVPVPTHFRDKLALLLKFGEEWPIRHPSGELEWLPVHLWEKEFSEWESRRKASRTPNR